MRAAELFVETITADGGTDRYQALLADKGFGAISTQIVRDTDAGDGRFYYAEDYHQQYLAKNPGGYCGLGGTGVGCPANPFKRA